MQYFIYCVCQVRETRFQALELTHPHFYNKSNISCYDKFQHVATIHFLEYTERLQNRITIAISGIIGPIYSFLTIQNTKYGYKSQ